MQVTGDPMMTSVQVRKADGSTRSETKGKAVLPIELPQSVAACGLQTLNEGEVMRAMTGAL
ncbi:MAG: hypothetical protein RIR97_1075 [Pseudomonadota bacterium]